MALGKTIIEKSDLETSYHRIVNISMNVNTNESIVTLERYVSKEYRDKAKEQVKQKQQLDNLIAEYNHAVETNNIEVQKALLEKINQMNETVAPLLNKDYVVDTKDIILEFIPENPSYRTFYEELAKLPEFEDAEEV